MSNGEGDKNAPGHRVERVVPESDDELNESCTASFEVDGYVSFHFTPYPMPKNPREWVRGLRRFRDGLTTLASKLEVGTTGRFSEKYAAARYVVVTSWIVALHEHILIGHGIDQKLTAEEKTLEDLLVGVYRGREVQDRVPDQYRGPDGPVAVLRRPKNEFIQYWKARS